MRILRAVLCALIFSNAACASEPSEGRSYFPPSEFTDLEKYNSDVPKSWSEYLSVFHEPILFDDPSVQFAVRLTIAPAFSSGTIVRIFQDKKGRVFGTTRHLSLNSSHSSYVDVSADQLSKLRQVIDEENFWSLGNRQRIIASDGVQILLEVRDGSRYHVVYASVPSEGPLLNIARAVMGVAHINLPKG